MVAEVLLRLEQLHGVPEWRPTGAPVEALVYCMLSQNTSDGNARRAMEALLMRYPNWESLAMADATDLAATLHRGGLANVKAQRILGALHAIRRREGAVRLATLASMNTSDALAYLTSLPGVGPKTASIVLCFALGRPVLPVDTHVFRMAWRLGLLERRLGEARAHAALAEKVPEPLRYRFHMALLHHGRAVCKARAPRCSACPLTTFCDYHCQQVCTSQ